MTTYIATANYTRKAKKRRAAETMEVCLPLDPALCAAGLFASQVPELPVHRALVEAGWSYNGAVVGLSAHR